MEVSSSHTSFSEIGLSIQDIEGLDISVIDQGGDHARNFLLENLSIGIEQRVSLSTTKALLELFLEYNPIYLQGYVSQLVDGPEQRNLWERPHRSLRNDLAYICDVLGCDPEYLVQTVLEPTLYQP